MAGQFRWDCVDDAVPAFLVLCSATDVRTPDEILVSATGKPLSTEDYLADLSQKVVALAN
ncbi:hypothetical protein AU467_06755 [Mesorhizobium loti]|uniref:Uncharacterized protein n=1 Tax=Rhizobium loti TaxID=381 RepID=A0A117N2A4_RHILI|nr:hypothetical protein AU467_06755 [Mesorhizobium loti]